MQVCLNTRVIHLEPFLNKKNTLTFSERLMGLFFFLFDRRLIGLLDRILRFHPLSDVGLRC